MANVKITGLTAITAPANTDVLPIVDVSADVTKKVSVADLLESAGDGTAALPAFAFDSEKDIGMYRVGANQLGFATDATARLVIDGSGNVAIGATSADFKCHITGTGTDLLKIQRSGAGGGARFRMINGDSNYYDIFHDGAENLTFGYNGSERMRISSSGNVGIGVSSPSAKLDVNGSAEFASTVEIGNFSSTTAAAVYMGSGAVQAFRDSGVNAATSPVFIGGRKDGSSSVTNVSIFANGAATFGGPLTVSNLASGFSTFFHSSGNGGIKITGAAGGSNANLVFSNNYTGTIDDIWTIQMQGADDSLAFRAGGPGDSDVITFTSTGAATFAGRITNGPVWDTSTSLNQAIIDNGTVYTHRQQATDAVFSAFQGTQGTQNVNILAEGSAEFVLNVRTGGIQSTIPASPGSNNLYNFFQSKRATTEINTAFADSGGAQVVRLYNNGNAIFNGAVTALKFEGDVLDLPNSNFASRINAYGGGNVKVFEVTSGGAVTCTGAMTAQSYVTSSDQRFKENITDASSQLADVTALGNKLRNWDWTADAPVADKDTRFLGLVAQEAETICPGIVKTIARTKQGAELTPEVVVPAVYETRTVPAVLDDEGEVVEAETTEQVLVTEEQITPATYEELDDSYKGISNDALIMKLLGAVAELSAKVAALEAG